MKLRLLFLMALAGALGVVPLGNAGEPLRLDEAGTRDHPSNPCLAAEAATVSAAQAPAQREGRSTPCVIDGGPETVGGPGSPNGAASAGTTVRLGRVIDPGGKHAARYRRQTEGTARSGGDTPAISTAP